METAVSPLKKYLLSLISTVNYSTNFGHYSISEVFGHFSTSLTIFDGFLALLGVNGIIWNHIESYGIIWNHMESYGVNGITWNHTESIESRRINGVT